MRSKTIEVSKGRTLGRGVTRVLLVLCQSALLLVNLTTWQASCNNSSMPLRIWLLVGISQWNTQDKTWSPNTSINFPQLHKRRRSLRLSIAVKSSLCRLCATDGNAQNSESVSHFNWVAILGRILLNCLLQIPAWGTAVFVCGRYESQLITLTPEVEVIMWFFFGPYSSFFAKIAAFSII